MGNNKSSVNTRKEIEQRLISRSLAGESKFTPEQMTAIIEDIKYRAHDETPEETLTKMLSRETDGKVNLSPLTAEFLIKSARSEPQAIAKLNLRQAFEGREHFFLDNKDSDTKNNSSTKKQEPPKFSN